MESQVMEVQSEDNEGSQLSPKCLRISLILRKILENFSNSELLELSFVNKQWNYEARSVVKDRGITTAHLDPHQLCKDSAVFASYVRQMNVVPYTGIRVFFKHHAKEKDPGLTYPALDSSFNAILNRLQLKHLELGFHGFLVVNHVCPANLLVEKILRDHCGVLESLHLDLKYEYEDYIQRITQHSIFPKLTNLKLRFFLRPLNEAVQMFIKTMVSRAPNLLELHLDHPVARIMYKDLLEGSSAVLAVDNEVDPLYDFAIRNCLNGPFRLRRMRLEYQSGRNFSMEIFNRVVPQLLQASCATLQSLTLDSMFAPILMRYGIRLANVTKLTVQLSHQVELRGLQCISATDVPAVLRILQDFDFTYIFPKLNEVGFNPSPYIILPMEVRQLFNQGNFVLQDPSPDRTVSIKHLNYKCLGLTHLPMNVPFLASMFPHIETLLIEKRENGPAPPYGLIWEHWVHLKQLVVKDQGVWRHNLDSLFCGLFPEEIAQLREKDDEYLKAVNIVPVMPSITCLKDLRTFTLSDCGHGFDYGENDPAPAYVFSKVTALIAFARIPKLAVTLKTTWQYAHAWSHMKEYVPLS